MRAISCAFLLTVAACNPFAFWGNATAQRDVAEQATARFHTMLDSTNYQAIWSEADPEFRNAGPQKDAIALFRMINRRFGTVQDTKLVTWNVNFSTGSGTLVRLVYRTSFSRDSATETFNWRIRDDKPALIGYNINAPALLPEKD